VIFVDDVIQFSREASNFLIWQAVEIAPAVVVIGAGAVNVVSTACQVSHFSL